MDQKSRLISLVKNYEFLYKNDSRINKGTLRKKDAWTKIGAELNISGSKCKMIWKNLRKWYRRAKLRRAQNPEGCTKKVRVWRYEKQLTFLDEVQSWKTPIEHDYTQPSSSISSQTINDSNTRISSKDSGSFHIPSLQRQQPEDNYLQSNALGNVALNLPQKQLNINNCYEPTTLGKVTQNAAKDPLQQKRQNVDKCFQSGILQIVSQLTQKENKVDKYARCTTISNIINPIFDENDNSSEEYQLRPISYNTSSRPPTVFEDLHEKIENFLESATATVNKLQQKEPKNSTSLLFQSLARRITTSNLTKKQINDIEGGTCMLVYTDLEKFYLANKPPKL